MPSSARPQACACPEEMLVEGQGRRAGLPESLLPQQYGAPLASIEQLNLSPALIAGMIVTAVMVTGWLVSGLAK